MKILFVASTYSHIKNFHLPTLRRFCEQGREVCLACGGEPESLGFVAKTVALPFEKRMTSPSNLKAAKILRGLMKAENFDLLITHTSLAAFFARIALFGLKPRPKVINVSHGYLYDDATSALKRTVLRTAERITARRTDLVLTMNAWDFEEAKRYRLGARVALIPGVGVDFSRADPPADADSAALRASHGVPADAFVLFCAAEFSPRKNQAALIRAMQRLPDGIFLVLAGDGALRGECIALAERLGVAPKIAFPGHVDAVGEWLSLSDSAVSASRIEGLPWGIMEAMHAGLPCVASRVKGHTDLIRHGETGLLCDFGDEEGFARAAARLAGDAELCKQLGSAAHDSVQKYALAEVLPQVMSEYESVCAPRERA